MYIHTSERYTYVDVYKYVYDYYICSKMTAQTTPARSEADQQIYLYIIITYTALNIYTSERDLWTYVYMLHNYYIYIKMAAKTTAACCAADEYIYIYNYYIYS